MAALVDIRGRFWETAAFVAFVGPISYLLFERRRQENSEGQRRVAPWVPAG